jgi:hypothetical protein
MDVQWMYVVEANDESPGQLGGQMRLPVLRIALTVGVSLSSALAQQVTDDGHRIQAKRAWRR